MIRACILVDDAVGEMRRCLVDDSGRPFRLAIDRWTERNRRAEHDEIWWGRARARLPGGGGWFVDLGLPRDGLLNGALAGKVAEGALVAVRIKSEAWADKGPVLSLVDLPAAMPRPDAPARHAIPETDPFLAGVDLIERIEDSSTGAAIDAAIEDALAPLAPIAGGGDLCIETTRALTAIDIDSGARIVGEADVAAFNIAAAQESARQIALRGLAGLVALDTLTMRTAKERAAVSDAFRDALRLRLGRASEVEPIGKLGVCIASIARRARPLADALAAPDGEREALDALRLIERVGRSEPGRRIHARVSAEAAQWLAREIIDWPGALADRIARRWEIEIAAPFTRTPDVFAAR